MLLLAFYLPNRVETKMSPRSGRLHHRAHQHVDLLEISTISVSLGLLCSLLHFKIFVFLENRITDTSYTISSFSISPSLRHHLHRIAQIAFLAFVSY